MERDTKPTTQTKSGKSPFPIICFSVPRSMTSITSIRSSSVLYLYFYMKKHVFSRSLINNKTFLPLRFHLSQHSPRWWSTSFTLSTCQRRRPHPSREWHWYTILIPPTFYFNNLNFFAIQGRRLHLCHRWLEISPFGVCLLWPTLHSSHRASFSPLPLKSCCLHLAWA